MHRALLRSTGLDEDFQRWNDCAVSSSSGVKKDQDREAAGNLVEAIWQGDKAKRKAALQALETLARRTGDPEIWQSYAYGLDLAGDLGRAIAVLDWLVANVPSSSWYQIHLARVRNASGAREPARQILRDVVTSNPPAAMLRLARLELPMLLVVGPVTVEDHAAMDRQRGALRERISRGEATDKNVIDLALLAGEQRRVDHDGRRLLEALNELDAALVRSPEHVGLLEQLAVIRVLVGNPEAETTLLQLERVAPDSPFIQILESIDSYLRDDDSPRLAELLRTVSEGDEAERAAALAELDGNVVRSPDDGLKQTVYAIALLVAGRRREALEHASIGALLAGESHPVHYNAGMVFMGVGETARAERHLSLARDYATTAEERADTDELLAKLEDD